MFGFHWHIYASPSVTICARIKHDMVLWSSFIPLHANPNIIRTKFPMNIDWWPSPNNNLYSPITWPWHIWPWHPSYPSYPDPWAARSAAAAPKQRRCRTWRAIAPETSGGSSGFWGGKSYKIFMKCTPLKFRQATKKAAAPLVGSWV